MPDPNRSLLPLWDDEHTDYTYDCLTCRAEGLRGFQSVTFWRGEPVPSRTELPCFASALLRQTGLHDVPIHVFKLIGPVRPAGEQ